MSRLALMASLACALVFSGCTTVAKHTVAVPAQLFDDQAFPAPTSFVSAAEAVALSPQMKRYLEVDIAPQIRRLGRQAGLVEALYSHAHLRLEYDTDVTRTAAEAFDARAGNCLSLVLMTAALAKELSLPVSYQALVGQDVWQRSGDLSLVIGHVNVTVAKRLVDRVQGLMTGDMQLQLSFGNLPAGRSQLLRPVDEQTILAMFMNNRAAEALSRGDLADAYAFARESVVQDPRFAGAYNTLGVAYQRRGLMAKAAQAYSTALERDADNLPALANFANLLESQQRQSEASVLRARLSKLEAEPPFMHLDLGRAAVQAGDYRAGRDHLLRELRRDPDYHESHFWLALALAGLGDAVGAQEQLTLAKKTSTTQRDQALYVRKLERLQATTRPQ